MSENIFILLSHLILCLSIEFWRFSYRIVKVWLYCLSASRVVLEKSHAIIHSDPVFTPWRLLNILFEISQRCVLVWIYFYSLCWALSGLQIRKVILNYFFDDFLPILFSVFSGNSNFLDIELPR